MDQCRSLGDFVVRPVSQKRWSGILYDSCETPDAAHRRGHRLLCVLVCGLPLLRLFGAFADGGNGAGVHGCFLLGCWPLHFRVETRHVHAERHLAKAGVARRKGRGLPTLEEEAERWNGKGEAQRRSAQAQRGRLGKPLAPRDRGRAP
jgi:hypothetical protein